MNIFESLIHRPDLEKAIGIEGIYSVDGEKDIYLKHKPSNTLFVMAKPTINQNRLSLEIEALKELKSN